MDTIEKIITDAADECSGRILSSVRLRFDDIIRQAVKDALAAQNAADVRYVAEKLGKSAE